MHVLVLKLRKTIAGKSRGKKSSICVKSPSSPGPSAPNVDIDDRILSHFAVFSQNVDNRLAYMSDSFMNRLNEYWLLSSLLSQFKQDRYKPSEPSSFDKAISSLSASMALRTSLVSGVTDFVVSKRKESFLSQMSIPLSSLQKRELLVSPGSGDFLFDQSLLEKTLGQIKEDSIITSSVSLSKLAKSGLCAKSLSSSSSFSSRYFPLQYHRSESSGSPLRGSSAKRSHGGKGTTPSANKKGFHK